MKLIRLIVVALAVALAAPIAGCGPKGKVGEGNFPEGKSGPKDKAFPRAGDADATDTTKMKGGKMKQQSDQADSTE